MQNSRNFLIALTLGLLMTNSAQATKKPKENKQQEADGVLHDKEQARKVLLHAEELRRARRLAKIANSSLSEKASEETKDNGDMAPPVYKECADEDDAPPPYEAPWLAAQAASAEKPASNLATCPECIFDNLHRRNAYEMCETLPRADLALAMPESEPQHKKRKETTRSSADIDSSSAQREHKRKKENDARPVLNVRRCLPIVSKFPTIVDGNSGQAYKKTVQLWAAARYGNIKQLQELIDANVNPNVLVDDFGGGMLCTALIDAARLGKTKAVSMLLSISGINITALSIEGGRGFNWGNRTALDWAVKTGRFDIVKLLVDKAAQLLDAEDYLAHIEQALTHLPSIDGLQLDLRDCSTQIREEAIENLPLMTQFLKNAALAPIRQVSCAEF